MDKAPDAAAQKGRDTREKILKIAEELIGQRGYNGFSYRDVASRLGVKNAAIHYYFRAKSDLGEAVIKCYRDRFTEWARQVEAETDDAWKWLEAYFGIYSDILKGDEIGIFSNGVISAEFETLPENVQAEIRIMLRERYDWLIKVLQAGKTQGQLRFNGQAETKALEIAAATQGALQISRVVALGEERFTQVVEQIKNDLSRPENAGGSNS